LLSEDYIAQRRALIGDTASAEFRPGTPGGREGHLPPLVTAEEFAARFGGDTTASGGGEPTVPGASGGPAAVAKAFTGGSGHMFAVTDAEPGTDGSGAVRGDTCHIDVVDRWGNMISATPSGGWLQSSPAVPGLGFCLGA